MYSKPTRRWQNGRDAVLLAVDLGLEDADIGHIPVLLAVVQAVAHHELVGDLEAGIVGGDGLFAAGRLIQQGGNGDGGGALGLQVLRQEIQGIAGVQNILDDDDVAAADVALEVAGDLHHAGGLGGVLIGRKADELHLAFQLGGADQVRHENEAAVEDAHKHGVLVLESVIKLVAQLLDTGLDLLFRQQDLQDVLIHITLCHCLLSSVVFCDGDVYGVAGTLRQGFLVNAHTPDGGGAARQTEDGPGIALRRGDAALGEQALEAAAAAAAGQGQAVIAAPGPDGPGAGPQCQGVGGGRVGEGDAPGAGEVIAGAERRLVQWDGRVGEGQGAVTADSGRAAGQRKGAAGLCQCLQRPVVGGGEVLFARAETVRQQAEHTGTQGLRRGEERGAGERRALRRQEGGGLGVQEVVLGAQDIRRAGDMRHGGGVDRQQLGHDVQPEAVAGVVGIQVRLVGDVGEAVLRDVVVDGGTGRIQ